MIFLGSLWPCFMYSSAFNALKVPLKCVCKIISLKSQRFLRNLSQKRKHLYLLLRNGSFLQQKVYKLIPRKTMCCYSHSVHLFILFCLSFMLVFCPWCLSVLMSQSDCQIPSKNQLWNYLTCSRSLSTDIECLFFFFTFIFFKILKYILQISSYFMMSVCVCFLLSFLYYLRMIFLHKIMSLKCLRCLRNLFLKRKNLFLKRCQLHQPKVLQFVNTVIINR